MVPWLRQRLASFEDASLQSMAWEKNIVILMWIDSIRINRVRLVLPAEGP